MRPHARRAATRAVAASVALVLSAASAFGFAASGGAWPDGTIPMNLARLDTAPAPTVARFDGSASWATVFAGAMQDWSARMTRTKFTRADVTGTPTRENGTNDVFFAPNIYGSEFGERTVAVTLINVSGPLGLRHIASDIVFNSNRTWNSYRGAPRSEIDFRRVALHELGHAIGLDHPDEDGPPQNVFAVMNSIVGAADSLTADDRAGAAALYSTPLVAPQITRGLQTKTLSVGQNTVLDLEVDGAPAPPRSPLLDYGWYFQPDGGQREYLFTVHRESLGLGAIQLSDAGTYGVTVETPAGWDDSPEARINVQPVATSPDARLTNLSTRGLSGSGHRSMIAGFFIAGTSPKRVLIRAAGPALSTLGVTNVLSNPRLVLRNESGTVTRINQDWSTPGDYGSLTSAEVAAASAAAGAFPFADGSPDAALLLILEPGAYTAQAQSTTGAEGVALVEVYDLDDPSADGSRLANLSTRGPVGRDGSLMIAGFNVAGPGPRTYLLRAVGDTLAKEPFSVTGALDDPLLTLYDGEGNYLRELDDWDSPAFLQDTLRQTMAAAGAFPLTDRQESAMRLTLLPGRYTLHLSGFGGGTGIALVEIYELTE